MSSDVLVVGAGVSGASGALLLAQLGMRVTVIDKDPVPRQPDHEDPAVLAINPRSQAILETIGVWQNVPEDQRGPFTRIRVQDATLGQLHFDAANLCRPCLGQIVATPFLLHALHQAMMREGIPVVAGRLAALAATQNHLAVTLDNGACLKARLVIGADGSHSTLRSLAGLPYHASSYSQRTLATIAETRLAHGQLAWQRFTDSGPLALLPLADAHRVAVLWTTRAEQAGRLVHMEEESFNQALNEALGTAQDPLRLCGRRCHYPLQRAHARRYSADRVTLLGDAAHSVHPLAGLGANMGLGDAACLAECLRRPWRERRDIGAARWLRGYERRRRQENQQLIVTLDCLKRLFEAQGMVWQRVRRASMALLDEQPRFKSLIARQAMGLEAGWG